MSLTHTDESRRAMREGPFGDEPEAEIEEVLGKQLPPARIPEDDIRPGATFVFGEEVADVFEEEVIPRQIPSYIEMRQRALQIGHEFVKPNTAVLDLGTSRARMIKDLIKSYAIPGREQLDRIEDVQYIGVDNEDPMLDLARVDVNALFSQLGRTEEDSHRVVKLINHDLRQGIPRPEDDRDYSLITSILTLQFVPIEYRQGIIQDIYDNLEEGGAFIWIEKVLGTSAVTDALLTKVYHNEKRLNGISESAIAKKRDSIEGFLVPQTTKANYDFLHAAGFRVGRVETFWRSLQFEAYVAIK